MKINNIRKLIINLNLLNKEFILLRNKSNINIKIHNLYDLMNICQNYFFFYFYIYQFIYFIILYSTSKNLFI
jgi:hypothetical protein